MRKNMNFKQALTNYKRANPDIKQLTLRISKEHAKRLKKLAKENGIKEGACLRVLVELAIDDMTEGKDSASREQEVVSTKETVPVEEFNSLEEIVKKNSLNIIHFQKEIDALKQKIQHPYLK